MRLLVLGGTGFLSKAVAAEAVGRGHEVRLSRRAGPAGRRPHAPAGTGLDPPAA